MRLAKMGWLLLILPPCSIGLFGQNSKLETLLNDLQQVKRISNISMSPDGRWITWTQTPSGNQGGGGLFRLDTQGASANPEHVDTPGTASYERVVWSPDGTQFAFVAAASEGAQSQIYQASSNDFSPRKLTDLKGYVTDLHWSPDGRQLSFLFAQNGGGGGPLTAQAAQTGEVGSQLHNQRITVLAASGGEIRQVTPADLNVYEYAWSPDGQHFAAIAAPGPADNDWWLAKLYTADLESGSMHVIFTPAKQQQIAIPRWSPDGKQVAFIAGLMSDQGFVGGDILSVASSGGSAHDLTAVVRFSVSSLEWQSNDSLIFTAEQDGGGSIYRLKLMAAKPELIWHGEDTPHSAGNFPNLALASNGVNSAIVHSTWQDPPEVWAGPLGKWQQVTHINSERHVHWGKAQSITWTNPPFHAQGWLLYPEDFDPGKTYGLIVSVHGGPSGQHTPAWPNDHFDMSILSAFDYFVFFPNPRGSYGQGEAFTKANVKDFGRGDLQDILVGIDTVSRKVHIDSKRIGITGWSYGGYMTMWTVTQTNRFHAAVAGAGIANWLSYYGENSIDEWMIPFFGASVYDDPAVYAKSSPITYIKNVKTPTLVLVGENDVECPAPQSFEFWHALKALDVPTRLVVYPGEGHAFHKPEDNLDRMRRTIEWFDQYLGTPSPAKDLN